MEHSRQLCGSVRDRISDLPDELLHDILNHLCSFPAAARTSALSRRWRRVWAGVPDIVLADDLIHQGASFHHKVDDALAAYTADPAVPLGRLEIIVPYECQNIPAPRVLAWLLSASRRLAGEVVLRVCIDRLFAHKPLLGEIELPRLERATAMTLVLGNRFLLQPQPVGVFAALADLSIMLATMDARALEVLVSSQCPRLQKLTLLFVTLVDDSDVSISSASLEHLRFYVRKTRRLNVATPNLQVLSATLVSDAHIAAPNLAELVSGNIRQFIFADAVRHLRRLEVKEWSTMAQVQLMRRFDTVDELRLHADVKEDEFKRFMDDTSNLPKCDILSISLAGNPYGAVPRVLHLLRRASRMRKLVISLGKRTAYDHCSMACPCRSPDSIVAHDISLDSLEEMEFRLTEVGEEYMELIKLLLSLDSLTKLKNVEIEVSNSYRAASLCDEVYQKVRSICPPNIRLNVFQNGRCHNQN